MESTGTDEIFFTPVDSAGLGGIGPGSDSGRV
jgi:hypothetical protein